MLCPSEHSRVGVAFSWTESTLQGHASWVGHLDATVRHRVASVVKGKVHVLCEQGQQVGAAEPPVESLIFDHLLPDLTLFARS